MTEPTPSPRPPPAGMGPHPLVAVRLCVVDCDLVVAGVAAMVRDARGIEVVDARAHIVDGMLDPALLTEIPTRDYLAGRLEAFMAGAEVYEERLDRLRIFTA